MKPVSAASLGRIHGSSCGLASTGPGGGGSAGNTNMGVASPCVSSPSTFRPASCNAMMAVKN